jgi:N6-adenosine-specific RNA methylase IME4
MFTIYGLQKKIALVNQYLKNWNLNCNSRKSHIMVFKRGRKLKATEGWRINGQNLEVVDNFNY